ncbi:MAG: hypothetical protein IJC59_05875 [Lachnospiraceae bacterium]|nr:hypothetical protein [Lachnospiraceae bacterium]
MAIGQVELNTAMSRIQDFSIQKQNEDNKGVIDQGNFQNQFKKEITNNLRQVNRGDQAESRNEKHDAREKGKNQYAGDGGRHRRKGEGVTPDGVVVSSSQRGFDIKI